ncbi:hypothetical protein TRSC58_06201, partial [Trypanosoma rangeli SC58]
MRKYDPLPTAVVRELPRKGQGAMQAYTVAIEGESQEWAPIRIAVSMEDLNDPSKYCTQEGELRPDFRGGSVQCGSSSVLTAEKRQILEAFAIPKAVKMHSERLRVRSLISNLVVPKFIHQPCSEFSVSHYHQRRGIPDADTVVYVAAGPSTGIVAWAAYCATIESGRPFVGVSNYDPDIITGVDAAMRAVLHEIVHILGFDYRIMSSLNMTSQIPNVRGKPFVEVVSSPKTKEKARAHYNCSSAPGM